MAIYIVALCFAAVGVYGRLLLFAVVCVQGEVMSRVGMVALVRCKEGEKKVVSTKTTEEEIKERREKVTNEKIPKERGKSKSKRR